MSKKEYRNHEGGNNLSWQKSEFQAIHFSLISFLLRSISAKGSVSWFKYTSSIKQEHLKSVQHMSFTGKLFFGYSFTLPHPSQIKDWSFVSLQDVNSDTLLPFTGTDTQVFIPLHTPAQ